MINSFLGWVFDQVMREPVAEFRRNLERPFSAQERSLRRILDCNRNTEFGRTHDFGRILFANDSDLWRAFRRAVPIRTYTSFLPRVERMKMGERNILVPGVPEMFSLTSGTTSEPKFCPVNRAFILEHHRQHLLWMYNIYRDHPGVNQGKYLIVASPAEMGRTAGGIPYGAMSGKQLETQSIPVRRRMAAPALTQRLENSDERWFNFVLFALAEENLRLVTSVNPSSLVVIAHRLDKDAEALLDALENGHPALRGGKASEAARRLGGMFAPNPERARKLREIYRADGTLTPAAAWPGLELLLTWQGGSSAFYLPHVDTLWGRLPKRCLGLRASEGTFSIPLRNDTASGTLAVGGHAMEFFPADDGEPQPMSPTLLAGELEEGGLYRLIVTTSGGFCRYDMGDLVRVTGFNRNTPEVAFERRAGAALSATGEKLTEDQVLAAMSRATAGGPLLNGFTLTWEMDGPLVRYVVGVEMAADVAAMRRQMSGAMLRRLREVLETFDAELARNNCEYMAKREDGRLAPPRLLLLAGGTYEGWRARAVAEGRPENQVKQPVMVRPPGPGRAPVAGCPFFGEAKVAMEL